MNSNDVKKGISIQAKADAAKVEKLAKGLNAHKAVLANLESGQDEIRDTMGIVLDDLSAGEAQMKYNLQVNKLASELDYTEKRVLCACIYTLIGSYEQNNPIQIAFYTNLEKYFKITERKSDFDFEKLSNIDSHTDRLVILKVICSFLFLRDESFSFLREKDAFYWLFGFASVKDISVICSAINAEYSTLGVEGVLNRYILISAPQNEIEEQKTVIEIEVEEQYVSSEEAEKENYSELIGIISEFVSDEASFGKGVAFSKKDLKKELPKAFSRVAFDSLVAVSKIERGYLIFTTYALYIKIGDLLTIDYVCIPYERILTDKITTSQGKVAGTSKISIPVVMDNAKIKTFNIDSLKLEEEKLSDLLVKISKSGCKIPKTDRAVNINELPTKVLINLLSAVVYMLRKEDAYLTEVYGLTKDLGLDNNWDQLISNVFDDESLTKTVKTFFDEVPYPSKHDISLEAVEMVMGLVVHNNILNGIPSTTLSLLMNNYTRALDKNSISAKEFNLMMRNAANSIKIPSIDKYLSLKEEVECKGLTYKDNIIMGIDKAILLIQAGFNFKMKEAIEKRARIVADVANTFQGKVKEGVNDIADKAKKGASKALEKRGKKQD
jgi:hypothetical protein